MTAGEYVEVFLYSGANHSVNTLTMVGGSFLNVHRLGGVG
jgi:hypothetical protein